MTVEIKKTIDEAQTNIDVAAQIEIKEKEQLKPSNQFSIEDLAIMS